MKAGEERIEGGERALVQGQAQRFAIVPAWARIARRRASASSSRAGLCLASGRNGGNAGQA